MHEKLYPIMELSCPDQCNKEAKKKLVGTYIRVNGKIGQVDHISMGSMTLIHSDLVYEYKEEEIESIEVLLPEPGMYLYTKNGDTSVLQITKHTSKQWRKSFNCDLYRITDRFDNLYDGYLLDALVRLPDIYLYQGDIYYQYTKIGEYKLNPKGKTRSITLYDDTFKQELKDIYGYQEEAISILPLQTATELCGIVGADPDF